MMQRRCIGGVIACLLGIWGWPSQTWADRLVLDNGEVLTGSLVRLEQGNVIFASEYLAEQTVDCNSVDALTTQQPVVLELADGQSQEGLLVDPNGFSGVALDQEGKIQYLGLDEVLVVRSLSQGPETASEPPRPEPEPEPQKDPKKEADPWTGSVNGGVTTVYGNSQTQSCYGSLKLNRRVDKIKAAITSDYARANQKDIDTGVKSVSQDWWKAYGKLNYYFTTKNYTYVDGRYEIDNVANLKYRLALGAGAGYQLVESEEVKVSFDLGGASLREQYQPGASQDSRELSLQMGYDVNVKINDHLKLTHDISYYPNARRFSDYYLTSTTELRQNFTKKLFANMKGIFNYDAVPASGALSMDIKYIVGVGLNF